MPDPEATPAGIRGPMSRLYDVFIDWPGRLAREMPGIEKHLRAAGARRVLDAGCGTGRHVQALLERGFDAHGADASEDMLEEARALIGSPERFHLWRMGAEPPPSLPAAGPFEAVIAMGNVWPQLAGEVDARRTLEAFVHLLRPGGLVLLGLKAFAVRQASGNPYLPLLRRVQEERPLWFIRFVDFAVARLDDGTPVCDLHMLVAAGDAESGPERTEALLHRATRMRVWSPAELEGWLADEGLTEVHVSARLDDPLVPPQGEDVFASGRAPLRTP
ncbi:MAG TPA: class I SAM-dependent methyltransferase [Planctomycetota bacterium]|nr:class I SAM-dependent methyltransferase [Planctomycetota bacterium]